MASVLYYFFGDIRLLSGKTLRMVLALAVWFSSQSNNASFAQTCSGSSSESIISQPFGSATGGSSLAELTTYQYVFSTCPDNGQYTTLESINGACFNNAWHTVTEDHTPNDVRGNMLVINASNEVGAFFQQPLSGLCGGNQYEFSVWGLNLLRPGICSEPNLPNLTIRIETQTGRVLQTIDFGSISVTSTPTWRRFSTLFTAPTVNEPVVVKLINNQEAGGCGNDLALDDIELKQCEVCPIDPVYVPDVFTPNRDGVNDDLAVFLRPDIAFTMKIYNRWGSLVFASDALDQKWNGDYAGSPCAPGDYTWTITYRLVDPVNVTRDYTRTGHVMLMR